MYGNMTTTELNARGAGISKKISTGRASASEQVEFNAIAAEINRREAAGDTETRGVRASSAQDAAFERYLRTGDHSGLETRTTADGQTTDTTAGGYTVPQGFWDNLQVAMKAYGGIGNDYRLVETDTGNLMPWPTVDPTGAVAGIVGTELTQLDVGTPYVFGQGTLSAYTYATDPILASLQLVQDSAFDVDQFVMERVAEQIGRAKAAKAVSGSGSGEPQGIITVLNAKGAVSTSGGYLSLTSANPVNVFGAFGDSATTEVAGKVLAPETVLKMVKPVDSAYLSGCKFYFSSEMAWNQRAVVDSSGRPILNLDDGYSDGAIGTMFGFDVVIDNSMTSITASTTTGPVFGNMQAAMVERRVRNGSVMRLDQRWADYLAVGFIGYERSDYRANDLRAAVCIKAAST
jgi:HK97 family phage major capsid protein